MQYIYGRSVLFEFVYEAGLKSQLFLSSKENNNHEKNYKQVIEYVYFYLITPNQSRYYLCEL